MQLDRGIWVTWYDLLPGQRDAHLKWAHEEYIPAMLKQPGILWGCHYAEVEGGERAKIKRTEDPAVSCGSKHMMLFGAEEASTFGKHTPDEMHAELSEASRKMLVQRVEPRTNIMAEYGRVQGPEGPNYKEGMTLSPCIQFGTYNTDWKNEQALMAYYAQGRMKFMSIMPTAIRTRKLVTVAGWAKHGVIYEFTSLEGRNKNFPGHGDEAMKAWSARMIPTLTHAPGSANLALRIWPPLPA